MADKKERKPFSQASVLEVYEAAIDDVIKKMSDKFLEEGVPPQVLENMKNAWRTKLLASKAIELNPEPNDSQSPPPMPSKASNAEAAEAAEVTSQNPPPMQPGSSIPLLPSLDPNSIVPVNITLPLGAGSTESRVLTIQLPASAVQENLLLQIFSVELISSIMPLPTSLATSVLQQHVNAALSELNPEPNDSQPPPIIANNPMPSKASNAEAAEVTSQNPPPLQPTLENTTMPRQPNLGAGSPIPLLASLDPNSIVPVNITLPPGAGSTESRVLTIQVPASAVQENQLLQIFSVELILSLMPLPTSLATSVLQQHVNAALSELNPEPNESQPPPIIANNPMPSKASNAEAAEAAEVTSQNPPPLQPTLENTTMPRQPNLGAGSPIPLLASLDPNSIVPVNIALPPGAGSTESRVLTIQVPASAVQENQLLQIFSVELILSLIPLPTSLATSVLQQHVNAALNKANYQKSMGAAKQRDGALDSLDENECEDNN